MKTGYGFEQPPGPTFPVEPEPDYLPTIRLFINPAPSPDSKIQKMMRYVAKLFKVVLSNSFVLISTLPFYTFFQFHHIIYPKNFFPIFHKLLQDATPNCGIHWRSCTDVCRGDWAQDWRHVGFINPRTDIWTADWELLQCVFTRLRKWGILEKVVDEGVKLKPIVWQQLSSFYC